MLLNSPSTKQESRNRTSTLETRERFDIRERKKHQDYIFILFSQVPIVISSAATRTHTRIFIVTQLWTNSVL